MKLFNLIFTFIFYSCAIFGQNLSIKGSVFDASTNKALIGASLTLKNFDDNTLLGTTKADANGGFVFRIAKSYSFIVEASLEGYNSYTSKTYHWAELQDVYTVDKIYLTAKRSDTKVPSQKVDTLPPKQVLEKKFHAMELFPTKGAFDLFYLLNPELRSDKPIPENYEIKQPKFPSFSETRQNFNQKFKRDKRRGEPYISSALFANPEYDIAYGSKIKSSLAIFSASAETHLTRDLTYVMVQPENTLIVNDLFGKPRKFVFMIWKTSAADGQPITDGPDVVGKYRVFYYQPIKKGDTTAYNIASNATHGYAPMEDSKYNIEVYNQETGKRVNASDQVIDPHEYFLRHDIWVAWNISWIKILIRVND